MDNKRLVSVCIITFNSSETVLETLESIKKQTYEPIELMISDDCSTDNTSTIIKNWVTINKKYFNKVKISQNAKNYGITKNLNIGIKQCTGNYIKLLAGDDLLCPNCIELMVKFLEDNNLKIAFSKTIAFNNEKPHHLNKDFYNYDFFYLNYEEQKNWIIRKYNLNTTGIFYKKEFVEEMGLYEEEYPMMEDYPFVTKVLKMQKEKIYLCDEYLVMYRLPSKEKLKNIKYLSSKRNTEYINSYIKFVKKELIPLALKEKNYFPAIGLNCTIIEKKLLYLNNNCILHFIGKLFSKVAILLKKL